ncbi:hypothetical protein POM88_020007 [Heracleum sosnowskyi]|uniref:Uncharacterized protein n=1 Tax=Heracleum sosnowskyi TaxID=360622 RepID=A0AAD8ID10_9APIA|nr:hypothetical protein POM88_020007 [Heracleum sosnowskyi]
MLRHELRRYHKIWCLIVTSRKIEHAPPRLLSAQPPCSRHGLLRARAATPLSPPLFFFRSFHRRLCPLSAVAAAAIPNSGQYKPPCSFDFSSFISTAGREEKRKEGENSPGL